VRAMSLSRSYGTPSVDETQADYEQKMEGVVRVNLKDAIKEYNERW